MTVGPEFYAKCEVEGGLLKLKALVTALEALVSDNCPNPKDSHHATVWLTEMLGEAVEETFKAFEALPAARAAEQDGGAS